MAQDWYVGNAHSDAQDHRRDLGLAYEPLTGDLALGVNIQGSLGMFHPHWRCF